MLAQQQLLLHRCQCTHTLNTEAHELLELSYSLREGLCHLGVRGGAAGVLILEHITQGGR